MFGLKTLMSVLEPVQRNSSVFWSTTVIFHLGHPKILQCITAIVVNMAAAADSFVLSFILNFGSDKTFFSLFQLLNSILILQLQNDTQCSLKRIHWRFRQGWWEL